MNKAGLDEWRGALQTFLKDFKRYVEGRYYSGEGEKLKEDLQQKTGLISRIVSAVHGGLSIQIGKIDVNFTQALGYTLSGNLPDEHERFVNSNIELTLNQAIGNIVNGTIPARQVEPIIPIKDEMLKKRCLDLLNAPNCFDRVINQATQILEDRLRNSVSYERLCELLPQAKHHIGETLANRLLGSDDPVIIISDKPSERAAFHKMVVGIIAYLRNPAHHFLDDRTERSLAWSVVGVVDALLSQLGDSYVSDKE